MPSNCTISSNADGWRRSCSSMRGGFMDAVSPVPRHRASFQRVDARAVNDEGAAQGAMRGPPIAPPSPSLLAETARADSRFGGSRGRLEKITGDCDVRTVQGEDRGLLQGSRDRD